MKIKNHIELNSRDSSFTGTATYYFGEASWDKNDTDAFISISDCYNTIRLHPLMNKVGNMKKFNSKELKRFKKKLLKLEEFIREFREGMPDKI